MEPRNQRSNITRRSALTRGGTAPLFDRLCGDSDRSDLTDTPGDSSLVPFRIYGLPQIFKSVLRELRALLNTRLPVSPALAANTGPETVLTYGLPDFSSLNAASPADRLALARLIERKIEAFEPRLKNVFVSLAPDPLERGVLTGVLHATLQIESVREPVSFRLIHGKQGVILTESVLPEARAPETNAIR